MSEGGPLERSSARLAAVQALYEMDMTGIAAASVIDEFLRKRWIPAPGSSGDGEDDLPDLPAPDASLLSDLVRGVDARRTDLDGMIGPALSGDWTVDRLEVLLRAILRAGAFELLSMSEVPARVVINEYVNVAKAFFDDSKPGLVNGVLDKLAHVLRTAELET